MPALSAFNCYNLIVDQTLLFTKHFAVNVTLQSATDDTQRAGQT